MRESFEFSANVTNLLFHGWNSSSASMLFGMCVAVGSVVLTLEGVTLLRSYIHASVKPRHDDVASSPRTASLPADTTDEQLAEQPSLLNPLFTPTRARQKYRQRVMLHMLQTVLRVMQLVMAYLVMLSIMSYNAWILVAVVIAYGIGYYFFGAVRDVISRTTMMIPLSESSQSVPSSSNGTEQSSLPSVL